MSDDHDFRRRSLQFGLASKEEINNLYTSNPRTIFLDVRSPQEIEDKALTARPYIHILHSNLSEQAPRMLPDKSIPIIVYCAAGGRSAGAKRALDDMGYEKVLNAGGLKDLHTLDD